MKIGKFLSRKKELLSQIENLQAEYIKSVTKLKIGDKVKFIEEGDSYIGKPDVKHKTKIYGFEVRYDGEINVLCRGIHYRPLLKNLTKCRS